MTKLLGSVTLRLSPLNRAQRWSLVLAPNWGSRRKTCQAIGAHRYLSLGALLFLAYFRFLLIQKRPDRDLSLSRGIG